MPGWIESRIQVIEQRVERLYRDLQALIPSIRAAQQANNQSGSVPQSGGGGGGFFVANHLTLAAATGTFPSITPSSTTADVYRESGGALVIAATAATIYNFSPDATDATKRQFLASNGDGTWTVITQSCSNG